VAPARIEAELVAVTEDVGELVCVGALATKGAIDIPLYKVSCGRDEDDDIAV
jgi:hypothetical protein